MIQKLIYGIISIIVLNSCSDNLSNSKAKDIISDCIKKNHFGSIKIFEGDNLVKSYSPETIKYFSNLKKLDRDGLIKFDSLRYINGLGIYYNLHMTSKAKEFILTSAPSKKFPEINEIFVKAFNYKLLNIININELDSSSSAEVTTEYSKISESPFSILDENDSKLNSEVFTLIKTDKGWKGCD